MISPSCHHKHDGLHIFPVKDIGPHLFYCKAKETIWRKVRQGITRTESLRHCFTLRIVINKKQFVRNSKKQRWWQKWDIYLFHEFLLGKFSPWHRKHLKRHKIVLQSTNQTWATCSSHSPGRGAPTGKWQTTLEIKWIKSKRGVALPRLRKMDFLVTVFKMSGIFWGS